MYIILNETLSALILCRLSNEFWHMHFPFSPPMIKWRAGHSEQAIVFFSPCHSFIHSFKYLVKPWPVGSVGWAPPMHWDLACSSPDEGTCPGFGLEIVHCVVLQIYLTLPCQIRCQFLLLKQDENHQISVIHELAVLWRKPNNYWGLWCQWWPLTSTSAWNSWLRKFNNIFDNITFADNR